MNLLSEDFANKSATENGKGAGIEQQEEQKPWARCETQPSCCSVHSTAGSAPVALPAGQTCMTRGRGACSSHSVFSSGRMGIIVRAGPCGGRTEMPHAGGRNENCSMAAVHAKVADGELHTAQLNNSTVTVGSISTDPSVHCVRLCEFLRGVVTNGSKCSGKCCWHTPQGVCQ